MGHPYQILLASSAPSNSKSLFFSRLQLFSNFLVVTEILQEMSTVGGCRYRQAIPQGAGGRLDINANYGVRREILPQVQTKIKNPPFMFFLSKYGCRLVQQVYTRRQYIS